MAYGSRTVYPGKQNKGLSSTFKPPEEGRSVQRPKRCDKHGEKDGDNSSKNVNNQNSFSITSLSGNAFKIAVYNMFTVLYILFLFFFFFFLAFWGIIVAVVLACILIIRKKTSFSGWWSGLL